MGANGWLVEVQMRIFVPPTKEAIIEDLTVIERESGMDRPAEEVYADMLDPDHEGEGDSFDASEFAAYILMQRDVSRRAEDRIVRDDYDVYDA